MELLYCAPCLFGLEGPLKNELSHMGFQNVTAGQHRVFFTGDELGVAAANIKCRFAERILIQLGSFKAKTFDALFEGVKALPWENFIPKNGAFPVKGYSLSSMLHSVPDCQSIVKKAVSVRLGNVYHIDRLPENGALYRVSFSIVDDTASLFLDTTGVSLHKRGYRPAQVEAPLRETLAAAIVDLSGYRGKGDFCDPFCGSGTIAIEAALAAKRRAPGLNREFVSENWRLLTKSQWQAVRDGARENEFDREYSIFASDIDPHAIEIARENAKRAGVADIIRFKVSDARKFNLRTERGIIVTNPPYGERLLDVKSAQKLMSDFSKAVKETESPWNVNVITSDEDLEYTMNLRASKTRNLYNGKIKCRLFTFPASK